MNLQDVLNKHADDLSSVEEVYSELYDKMFASHFSKMRQFYERMKSEIRPMTDAELEYVLSDLPLELFVVNSNLSRMKLDYEVLKLKMREMIDDYTGEAIESMLSSDENMSSTKMRELAGQYARSKTSGEQLLLSCYQAIFSRVESEQSFCRELIMGCKKIWDSRRLEEKSSPISAQDSSDTLPEYDVANNRKYPIYGS